MSPRNTTLCLFFAASHIYKPNITNKMLKHNKLILITHVSHFPQTIDKEIEGKCIIIYISVL